MGIIMERLDNTIPQLQDAIASGFENVSAGIIENTKSFGIAGLDSTFEIFSDPNLIAADNLLPTVSDTAAYPDPVASLTKQSSDSPVLQSLNDKNFSVDRELAEIPTFGSSKGNPKFDQFTDRTIDGKLADEAARKQAKGPVSEFVPDPPAVIPPSFTLPIKKTYFQTIDQIEDELQINPEPEIAQIFEQQFEAVKEMTSTVHQTLQLYQQIIFNSARNVK